MLSDLWNKIKEIVRKMLPKRSVEEILQVTSCISDRMSDAIQLWSDMYEGHSPWLKEPSYEDATRIVSLGLPALIASEKARMVTLEMKTEITAPAEADPTSTIQNSVKGDPSVGNTSAGVVKSTKQKREENTRAAFLNNQYSKVTKQIRRQLEYGIAKGGLVIKPYVILYNKNTDSAGGSLAAAPAKKGAQSSISTDEKRNAPGAVGATGVLKYTNTLPDVEIEFDFIQADRFFPLAFDANNKVVEAAFAQTKLDKARQRVYIRLEYHKLERRKVIVQNLAFESTDLSLANSANIKTATDIGKQIPLTDVPEWSGLQPITIIEGADRLLFAYFKMPEANTIDPYSPLGVSGYSRVIQLIKDADMQYSRMLWEFEGAELAIDVDRDALQLNKDSSGREQTILPQKQQRLFRKIDLNAEDTYKIFSPPIRDASLINGLNLILTKIEDNVGISRGTLAEVTTQEAKTATELKILKQRSFASNADIQKALQEALEDAVYVMDIYTTLYEAAPEGEYEISFEWDDSIIIDSESELSKRLTLMQSGLASKIETRMWYYGETEAQAQLALQKVADESTQAVLQNIKAEKLHANLGPKRDPEDIEEDPADETSKKISTGKQADDLDNPTKSKVSKQVKAKE